MKYIQQLLEGRWLVTERIVKPPRNIIYRLKNIYNDRIIEISDSGMRRIEQGKTTISKIIVHRMKKSGKKILKF